MNDNHYQPMIEVTRGPVVECIHWGALAVVDASGRLVAGFGDPNTVTFLRSAAKPFQALPFIEAGGAETYGLTGQEVALMCASHSGTDEHVRVLHGMQAKIGVSEAELMCGVHMPYHEETAHRLIRKGEEPTPNRHNCSGKHTGMLAHALMRHLPKVDYIDLAHPIQVSILKAFAEMCGLPEAQVALGVDGCSAPNFAISLQNAALGYARLADPSGLPDRRAQALDRIWRSMTAHPDMVGGPQRFDTVLMELTGGKLLAKSGAEGFQGVALREGALGPGSPALGIALKIADGDAASRAKTCAVVELLRLMGALDDARVAALAEFHAHPLYNFRQIHVGEVRPAFKVEMQFA